jgi:hypothetical protein
MSTQSVERCLRPCPQSLEESQCADSVELFLGRLSVAELHRPWRERRDLVWGGRTARAAGLDELDEPLEVVPERKLDPAVGEHRLEQLLGRLLRVKATMRSAIASTSSDARTSAMSSSARASSYPATSPSGGCKQAPLLQSMTHDMAPRARVALGLLLGIDDHVHGASIPHNVGDQLVHPWRARGASPARASPKRTARCSMPDSRYTSCMVTVRSHANAFARVGMRTVCQTVFPTRQIKPDPTALRRTETRIPQRHHAPGRRS